MGPLEGGAKVVVLNGQSLIPEALIGTGQFRQRALGKLEVPIAVAQVQCRRAFDSSQALKCVLPHDFVQAVARVVRTGLCEHE